LVEVNGYLLLVFRIFAVIAWLNDSLKSKVAQLTYRKITTKLFFGNIQTKWRHWEFRELPDCGIKGMVGLFYTTKGFCPSGNMAVGNRQLRKGVLTC